MPRKRSSDPDSHKRPSKPKAEISRTEGEAPIEQRRLSELSDPFVVDGTAAALAALLDKQDGWLRGVPGEKGLVYWKWKFNVYPWSNHYVMYVQQPGESLERALIGLYVKVIDVRMGLKRPTEDTYYAD